MQYPNTYYLILGRNPSLSITEIVALLKNTPPEIIALSREIILIKSQENPVNLMKRLGGTIKIGTIVDIKPTPSDLTELSDTLYPLIPTSGDQKISFGLSAYLADDHTNLPNIHQLRELGMAIKRRLQENKIKARLVTSRERALSSVIVSTNHLLDRGVEICLFFAQDKIYIGKTLAVQEFQEASFRDFGRPARAMKVGMLPIQLAKILINLAAQPLQTTILDPFCGFGTILSEAALMGYQNLIGTDINPQAIEGTKQNLEWLKTKFQITNYKLQTLQSDARQLSTRLSHNSIDAIITEPYMGSTRGTNNHALEVKNLIDLYIDTFREFKKILKPNGRVIFIFPIFKHNNTLTKTSDAVMPEIKKLGFEPMSILPPSISTHYLPTGQAGSPPTTHSIIYSRPDQKVLREIFVFQKL